MGKAKELRKVYSNLKARNEKWEERRKAKTEEAAAKGLNLSSYWEMTDDEFDEDMALSAANMNFCQDRYNLIGMARAWMQEGANQLAIFPGFCLEERAKRVVDLTNLLKKYIRSTKALGEEENQEAKEWLERTEKELPRAASDIRPLKFRLRSTESSSRVRMSDLTRASSPTGNPLRTSTPEAVRGGKKKEKKEDEAPKSNLEMKDASGKSNSGCPVTSPTLNPNHVCSPDKKVDSIAGKELPLDVGQEGEGEEDEEEEPEGPDYERAPKSEAGKKEQMHVSESILERKLQRPVSNGLKDTTIYKEYVSALDDLKAKKEEADKKASEVRVKEEKREERIRMEAQEREEQRRKEEAEREERKKEEEEEAKKRKEEEEAILEAKQHLATLNAMHEDRVKMAERRSVQIDQLEEKDRKMKEEWRKNAEKERKWRAQKEEEERQRQAAAIEVMRQQEDQDKERQRMEMEERQRKEEEEERRRKEKEDEERRKEEERRREEEKRAKERKDKEDKGKKDKKNGKSEKKKERKPSTSTDEEESSCDENDGWERVRNKRKEKKRRKGSESSETEDSDESSSGSPTTSSDSESEGGRRRRRRNTKSHRQLKHETMLKQRMKEARPRTDEEKFCGDERVNYQNFKQRF